MEHNFVKDHFGIFEEQTEISLPKGKSNAKQLFQNLYSLSTNKLSNSIPLIKIEFHINHW